MKKLFLLGVMMCVGAAWGWAQDVKVTSQRAAQTTALRDRTSQDWCINCEAGLADARAALAAAGSTAVNVVLMGDSISAGANGTSTDTNGYAYQVERELKRRFGKGNDESLWVLNNLDGSTTRWQKVVNGSDSWAPAGSNLNFGGIRGYAYTDTGTSANLRVANLYGTGIEFFYVSNPNTTATFTYKVDGGSSVNVTQSAAGSLAAATVQRVQITGLSLTTHTLDIFGPASGKVSITGVTSTIGSTGVRFHNWSQSGYTTNQWLGTPASEPVDNRAAAFAAVQPKLLIVALGVNDAGGTPNLATFESNLQTAITAQTYGSVLLLWTSPTSAGASDAVRRAYVDVLLKLVHANPTKVACLNGFDFFGSTTAVMSSRGYAGDAVPHPNAAGHRALAQLVLSALAPSADSGVIVSENSNAALGPRRSFRLVNGSNVTITAADNAADDRVDVTINASGGGTSGLTRLFSAFTQVTNGNNTNTQADLMTYTIPAGTLTANGQSIRTRGVLNQSSGTATVGVLLDGTNIFGLFPNASLSGIGPWEVDVEIFRTSATTYKAFGRFYQANVSTPSQLFGTTLLFTGTATWANALVLKFVVTANGNNIFAQELMTVDKLTP